MKLTDQCPKGSKAELCLSVVVREYSEKTKTRGPRLQVVVLIERKTDIKVSGIGKKDYLSFLCISLEQVLIINNDLSVETDRHAKMD